MESVKANKIEYSNECLCILGSSKMFFLRPDFCRAGGGGQPSAERLQDVILRPDRVCTVHDPRTQGQLQGKSRNRKHINRAGDERETTAIFKLDSCYCIGLRQSKNINKHRITFS